MYRTLNYKSCSANTEQDITLCAFLLCKITSEAREMLITCLTAYTSLCVDIKHCRHILSGALYGYILSAWAAILISLVIFGAR